MSRNRRGRRRRPLRSPSTFRKVSFHARRDLRPGLHRIPSWLGGRRHRRSSGIGEASSEHLASLGAKVAVLARRAVRLDDLVTRIRKSGGTAMAVTADMTDATATQAATDRGDARSRTPQAGSRLIACSSTA
ncbi:SDR family NAD(P)-dependent oxidoreductase [Streptomyces sp. 900105755]